MYKIFGLELYNDLVLSSLNFLDKERVEDSIEDLAVTITKKYPEIYFSFLNMNINKDLSFYSSPKLPDFLIESSIEDLKNEWRKEKPKESFKGLKISIIDEDKDFDADINLYSKTKLIVKTNRIKSGLFVIYFPTNLTEDTFYIINAYGEYLQSLLYSFDSYYSRLITDQLTGLYNHKFLYNCLKEKWETAIENDGSIGFVMLDIDHFKNFNDSYGHVAGDIIIKELGDLLVSITKKTDIISRYGGDEFSILLNNTNAEGAKAFVERILQQVRDHTFKKHGTPMNCTISIGYAVSEELADINNHIELIDYADKALFISKKSGRNQYCNAITVLENKVQDSFSEVESNRTLSEFVNKGRGHILVVDDDRPMIKLLEKVLKNADYEVTATTDPFKVLEIIKNESNLIDVLLSDINMPEMTGLQLIKSVRDIDPNIVSIIVTGFASSENTIEALRGGAFNIIQKPFQLDEIQLVVDRAVERRRMKKQLDAYYVNIEELLQEKTKELQAALEKIEDSFGKMIEGICKIQDVHESNTALHTKRVSACSYFLAKKCGITNEEDLEHIKYGALLHDIGKVAISDSILLKPGKLTDEEYNLMKEHVQMGFELVDNIPILKSAGNIVHCHHENFDGSGYPRGLKGEEICIGARIFSLVDTYDAMRFPRSYHNGHTVEEIVKEINRCSGTQFDPDIVDIFNENFEEFEKITQREEFDL